MEQLDRALGPSHERVVDVPACGDGAHRHGAVGEALGHRDHVRRHAEVLRAERGAEATEAGDDLVEDQQDAVPGADLAQPLQVALGRDQHPSRPRDRLDDHRGDVAGVVQRDQALELLGEVGAVLGLAADIGVPGEVVRVRQVVHTRQTGAEPLAVVHDAADRDAAEAHAVIAAFTADEAGARAFAAGAVVGERDLERGVDGFGTGVREEDVIEPLREPAGHCVRELEAGLVSHLERRRVLHRRDLPTHRLGDFPAAVARIDAPQAGHRIEDLPALRRPVVHALGAGQQARVRLELAVGRERHPEGFEIGTGERCGHVVLPERDRG